MHHHLAMCLLLALTVAAPAWPQTAARLDIDATDLPRHLLYATTTIPLDTPPATQPDAPRDVPLWYPKWVAGSHAPGGPAQNIAGLTITDQNDQPVPWTRTPGELHRIVAHAPHHATLLRVTIRYITDQPAPNSHGLDSFGADALGIISPNTVLVYPEHIEPTTWTLSTTLTLPDAWEAATALHRDPTPVAEGGSHPVIHYSPTTLELLVDSPIMVGRHARSYRLNERPTDTDPRIPPHRLHVFSEIPGAIEIDDRVLANYRAMVTQAARLFGSHPFDSMDILLATTNALPRNGLEHLRTTLNVIPLGALDSTSALQGWDRMLVPHEYVHAWCGKFRRPAGMVTGDFHTPQDTELLWVYEGLTQYLGGVLEVRSGMATPEEYERDLFRRIRWATHQQGRDWRPLADTGAAAHSLRAGSALWGHLRRSQDYYDEGSLIWMEADAIIRRLTSNQRSLDDFCRAFFRHEPGDPIPKPFDRDEVVRTLDAIAPHDWDTFLRERIDAAGAPPLTVIDELGYRVRHVSRPGDDAPDFNPLDALDSIGVLVSDDGRIDTVLLGTPADEAGLAPRTRILGIGDHLFSRARFEEALRATRHDARLTLLMTSGDRIVTRTIDYRGGIRFMTLQPIRGHEPVLDDILRPR